MSRLFWGLLPLGLLLAAIWWWSGSLGIELSPEADVISAAGIIFIVLFLLFAFIAQWMSYVQPRADHLRIVTPFLRLKVSYRRIRSIRSCSLRELYPPAQADWSERAFYEPYYSMTSLCVELTDYPLSKSFLRLFFPRQMFLPQTPGFVLITDDWMILSAQIDSAADGWRLLQRNRSRKPGTASW
jgi:hypothetical protein